MHRLVLRASCCFVLAALLVGLSCSPVLPPLLSLSFIIHVTRIFRDRVSSEGSLAFSSRLGRDPIWPFRGGTSPASALTRARSSKHRIITRIVRQDGGTRLE